MRSLVSPCPLWCVIWSQRGHDHRAGLHGVDEPQHEDGNREPAVIGKAFGRMFSGESMFQNTYTAQGGAGMIAFASSFPGSIKAVEIDPAHPVVVQKSGFLASEQGVELSIFFQKKAGAGFFGGEGFIMQKLSGRGTAFLEVDGYAVEYELQAGQSMVVDSGNLA